MPSAPSQRTDAGFTLVEAMIASAIIVTITSAILSNLIGSVAVQSTDFAVAQADTDANSVMAAIGNDVGSTGWYLPDGSATYLCTPAQDRANQYFPYILQQSSGSSQNQGLPLSTGYFPYLTRAAGFTQPNTVVSAVNMPQGPGIGYLSDYNVNFFSSPVGSSPPTAGYYNETNYKLSYYARSQEMVFLKAATGSWVQTTTHGTAAIPYAKAGNAFNTHSLYAGVTVANYANTLPSNYAPPTLDFYNGPNSDTLWTGNNNQSALGVLQMSGFAPVYDGSGNIASYTDLTLNTGLGSASGYTKAPYGRVLECSFFDVANNQELQWDTLNLPTYRMFSGTSTYDRNNLREYMYCVVPSPVGLGRLVRAVKVSLPTSTAYHDATFNPVSNKTGHIGINDIISKDSTNTYGMVIDKILSDNVVRIVFDTVRTAEVKANAGAYSLAVSPNQVRVRVYIMVQTAANSKVVIPRTIECTFAMRAMVGQQNAANATGFDNVNAILGLPANGNVLATAPVIPGPIPGLPH
jgi:type II secretory pathway pseudopilin PulG